MIGLDANRMEIRSAVKYKTKKLRSCTKLTQELVSVTSVTSSPASSFHRLACLCLDCKLFGAAPMSFLCLYGAHIWNTEGDRHSCADYAPVKPQVNQ